MEALTMFDPESGKYVEVHEACVCGEPLNEYEIETYGVCCESCANSYYEDHQRLCQQSNEC